MQSVVIKLSKSFFLKRTRKLLTAGRYKNSKSRLTRANNNPLMFVRAPKHFKSGKQHIFFFKGQQTSTYTLSSDNNFTLLHTLPAGSVFSTVTAALNKITYVDCLISRVTVKQPVYLAIK